MMAPFYTTIIIHNNVPRFSQACSGSGPSAAFQDLLKCACFEWGILTKEEAQTVYDELKSASELDELPSVWHRDFDVSSGAISVIAIKTDIP